MSCFDLIYNLIASILQIADSLLTATMGMCSSNQYLKWLESRLKTGVRWKFPNVFNGRGWGRKGQLAYFLMSGIETLEILKESRKKESYLKLFFQNSDIILD